MLSKRLTVFLSILWTSILIVSCSSSSGTVKTQKEEVTANVESKYPVWYNANRGIKSDLSSYYGYATALASDSATSRQKALAQAKAELRSATSGSLESIRSEAAGELGDDSGLNSPSFIVALRNAENTIDGLSVVEETEVKNSENNTYRSFVKVSADKKALISALDESLSSHGNAWNAMKETQAFQKF